MSLSLVTNPLTCEDLWRIREASEERLEIIDGELFATQSSTVLHQAILGNLFIPFRDAVLEPELGVVFLAMLDVRLANDTVVLPDLIVLLTDRRNFITEWGIDGPPSLLVEVVSSLCHIRKAVRDRFLKRDLYARYGVPEYWLADQEKGIVTVFSDPREDGYQVETVTRDVAVSTIIPELSTEVADLFAPLCNG